MDPLLESLVPRSLAALGCGLVFLIIGAAFLRARRVSRAELRTFKDLSRESGLRYRPPSLLRPATLAGNWRGRAVLASLGWAGLGIEVNIGGNRSGRAEVKYPVEPKSPTWGISTRMESTYHLTGEIAIIRRLSEGEDRLERIRELVGEFRLSVRLRSPLAKRRGRLVLRPSIAIGSQEQLVLLLDALVRLAGFLEAE